MLKISNTLELFKNHATNATAFNNFNYIGMLNYM